MVREAFARWSSTTAAAEKKPPAAWAERPPTTANARASFRHCGDVVETALEDDIFLARANDAEIYRLNPIAAALWRLFAEPVDAAAAAAVLAQAFPNVAADRIKADVAALIDDLAGRGLLDSPESDRG